MWREFYWETGFYNVQGGRYRKLQISFGAPTLLFHCLSIMKMEHGMWFALTTVGNMT